MVEIAKALSLQSRLVILDEPTSSLPIAETEKLLEVIAGLKAQGISVIFISHRLHEVVEASDRVVVLRDGNLVGTLEGDAINHDTMVRLMVGRELKVDYVPPAMKRRRGGALHQGRAHLHLSRPRDRPRSPRRRDPRTGGARRRRTNRTRARPVRHRPAAWRAASRSTARRCSLRPRPTRSMPASSSCPRTARAPACCSIFPIAQNITLPNLRAYARGGLVSQDAELERAEQSRAELDIRAADVAQRTALALGRQPAEGRARQVAGDEAEGHHLRRADARHRRRRQGRNLSPDARSCRIPGSRC